MGVKKSKETASANATADPVSSQNKPLISPYELLNHAKEQFYEGNNAFREARFDQAKTSYCQALNDLKARSEALYSHSDDPKQGPGEKVEAGDLTAPAIPKKNIETAAMISLGMLQFIQGCYQQSRELLQQALDLHRSYQTSSSRLKGSNGEKEKEKESLDCLVSVAVTIKRDFSANNRERTANERIMVSKLNEYTTIDAMISDLLNNLAACYEVIGDLNKAKTLFEECLHLRTIVYGKYSLKAAETMQNLATIFDSLKETETAKNLFSQALEIEKYELGEDHIESAVTMSNFAVLLAHSQQYEEARELLDKSVKLRESFYGPHHHLTICASQNLQFVKSQLIMDKQGQEKEKDEEAGRMI